MTVDPITTAADFARQLEADVHQHLGSFRLTLTRYAALRRADGTSASALALEAGVTQQAMSKTVRDLQLLGYLATVPDEDRRRRLLQLTGSGRQALALATSLSLPVALVAAMEAYLANHAPLDD